MDFLRHIVVPIHPAGRPFIAAFAAAALLAGYFLAEPLGWFGAVLTLWCVYFFRDPARLTPVRDGLVIAPADGRVCMIGQVPPPKELGLDDSERTRISIFMNVFDVHVNRAPTDGTITATHYHPGKFFNAELDKASEHNERMALAMKTGQGHEIAFVQIAGLVARRILCDVSPGEMVRAGERFGMIRFGSRVDVYLPPEVNALVAVGQRCVAGETVIADIGSDEEARFGEVR